MNLRNFSEEDKYWAIQLAGMEGIVSRETLNKQIINSEEYDELLNYIKTGRSGLIKNRSIREFNRTYGTIKLMDKLIELYHNNKNAEWDFDQLIVDRS